MAKKRRKSKKKKSSSTASHSLNPNLASSQEKQVDPIISSSSQKSENTDMTDSISETIEDVSQKQSDQKQHPLLVKAGLAFHEGNYQYVHRLIQQLDSQELSEEDQEQLIRLKDRISFDPVALWFPIGLFILWAFLFYRSLN